MKKLLTVSVFLLVTFLVMPLLSLSAEDTFGQYPLDEDGFYNCTETFADFAADNDVTILSLKNLVINGRFDNDLSSWVKTSNVVYNNGKAFIENPISRTATLRQNFVGNAPIYIAYDISGLVYVSGASLFSWTYEGVSEYNNRFYYLQDYKGVGGHFSHMGTGPQDGLFFGNTSVGIWSAYVDNVIVIKNTLYTKLQLDANLAVYGYLPYNVTYLLPDVTDPDFPRAYVRFFVDRYEEGVTTITLDKLTRDYDKVCTEEDRTESGLEDYEIGAYVIWWYIDLFRSIGIQPEE